MLLSMINLREEIGVIGKWLIQIEEKYSLDDNIPPKTPINTGVFRYFQEKDVQFYW